jgi:hypothetical protein
MLLGRLGYFRTSKLPDPGCFFWGYVNILLYWGSRWRTGHMFA